MKAPYCFIIKAVDGRRYDNIRTYGNTEFIVSTSQEDHTVSNRFAEVISVPIYYNGPIVPGDIIVVHHNVFKFYYDMKGRQKSSWHHLKDDLFIVEPDQVYLYSKDKENWSALSPFVFVRPIASEDKMFNPIGSLEDLWGQLVFKNDDTEEVEIGDIIVVHHNVFKFYYDMKGRQKSSWHHLKDDLFIVEPDQVYLYSKDKENWNALSPFVFVRPIPSEDKMFNPIGSLEELWGQLVFKNDDTEEVEIGDIISFTPDSEYEFRISNEILYRMYNRNICLKK